MYKLKTSEFNKINRSWYGRGTDFKHDIVETVGLYCYNPTSGICFIKLNKYLTGKDFMNEFLKFIRDEERRPNVLKNATIQPFVKKKHNINIGCYDGFRVCARNITERKIPLYM